VHAEAHFYAPLHHGDLMVIRPSVTRLGRSSMSICYTIFNQAGRRCSEVRTTKAFVQLDSMVKQDVPDDIRERLTALTGPLPPPMDPDDQDARA